MKILFRIAQIFAIPALLVAGGADQLLFKDEFAKKLDEGWSWLREHQQAWRLSDGALEIRVEPGNMWGPANNARNVLLRNAPDPATSPVEVSVQITNRPTEQYEQVDLVWYYSDKTMVKLGQELVDGKLSVVMGREENDRTRTIAIVPLDSFTVRLKLRIDGGKIRGAFRTAEARDWREVGGCDLPAAQGLPPKISIQCYQGPAQAEHWARIQHFRM